MQYEYKFLHLEPAPWKELVQESKENYSHEKKLNELGKEGWKIIHVNAETAYHVIYTLERQIQ
jgi:hypothetical protein